MKTTLLLIAFFSYGTLCTAQETTVIPKTDFKHHEFSVSYGFLPITDAQSIVEEVFIPVATLGIYKREKTNYYGAMNFSYIYRFNRKLSLGITAGITGNKGYASTIYDKDFRVKDDRFYFYILPTFRFHWFTRPNFSLYSSVGLGAHFLSNKIENKTHHRTRFAYQFNFLGIEYGKRFAFFTEFGVGYTGAIVLGCRYRF